MTGYVPTDARQAIIQFLAGQITGAQLLRYFMAHTNWIIPADAGASLATNQLVFKTFGDAANEHILFAFTDEQAYSDSRQQPGVALLGEHTIEASGVAVFTALDTRVTVVSINPNSGNPIHYKGNQIRRLKLWARTAHLEEALYAAKAPDDFASRLKRYDNYQVVVSDGGDPVRFKPAPDLEGRRLAAAMTADDNLEAFLDSLPGESRRTSQVLRLDGIQLFTRLQQMPFDGIVFNCQGPLPARAFQSNICGWVLNAE